MLAKKISILFLSLFLLATICEAQKFLALDIYKITGFKRIRFKEGDVIDFQLKGEKHRYSLEIIHITDSIVEVKGMNVPLKMIDMIYRDRSNFLTRSFSNVFLWGGLGFIILDTGNNAVNKDPVIVDKRAVIAGGSLMLIGGMMKILTVKKYKIGNKRVLKVIDVTD